MLKIIVLIILIPLIRDCRHNLINKMKRYVRKSRRPIKRRPVRRLRRVVRRRIIPRRVFRPEVKEVCVVQNLTQFNSGINDAGDNRQIIPSMSKGTNAYNRVGDQCVALKLAIRGHMIMNSTYQDSNSARIGVRMMIVQPKRYLNQSDVSSGTGWQAALLRRGSGTFGFTGSIADLYCPINRDAVTVYYDRVFYLSMPVVQRTTTAGTTLVNTATETSVDMYKTTKMFKITLKLRNKLLKYDDLLGGTYPENWGPVMINGYAHLNGASADVTNTQLGVAFDSTLYFKDP